MNMRAHYALMGLLGMEEDVTAMNVPNGRAYTAGWTVRGVVGLLLRCAVGFAVGHFVAKFW